MFFIRNTFAFPSDLDSALQASLWPEGESRLMEQRKSALRRLWPKLAKGRGQVQPGDSHYSFKHDEVDAYAAYYLPANCLKTALILEESFLAGIDPMPAAESLWLDCGTGPGTAYWGVSWWCAKR